MKFHYVIIILYVKYTHDFENNINYLITYVGHDNKFGLIINENEK